jgi:hypothetical protein
VNSLLKLLAAFVAGGVAGWAIENAGSGPSRTSKLFGSRRVPFLPVYGLGVAAVIGVEPLLSKLPILARGGIYAAGLSGLEYAAAKVDRDLGPPAWDYGRGAAVDLPHAAVWGLLGLGVEGISKGVQGR